MLLLFVVDHVFEVAGKGLAVGGANSDLNHLTKEEFAALVGTTVVLQTPSGQERTCSVGGVEVTSSIIDQKNFYILLSDKITEASVPRGSVVSRPGEAGSTAGHRE